MERLTKDSQFDMACFSIALDSEREKERSRLVPMQNCYKRVTEYLIDAKEQDAIKNRES